MISKHLETLTVKQLAEIAKRSGIRGWHDLRKAELISALKKITNKTAKVTSKTQKVVKTVKQTQKKGQIKSGSVLPKKNTALIKQKTAVPSTVSKNKKSPQKSEIAVALKKSPASRSVTGKAVSIVKSQAVSQKSQATPAIASVPPKALPKPPSKPKHEPIVVVEDHDGPALHKFGQKENLFRSRELGGVFEGDHLDQLVLVVCDPFWLQAIWELNIKLVERAKAAMGVEWHTAVPILRLYRVISDGISRQRRVHVRDVYPRGQVNNWYLDVQDPPASFFVEIGYISIKGRFFSLASSNTVETQNGNGFSNTGTIDNRRVDLARESQRHYAFGGGQKLEKYERTNPLVDQAKRPVPTPMFARFSDGPIESVKVELEVDVVIYGKTLPDAQLTIKNEPVRLQPDGKFTFRFQLPEKRQVYPIVAVSSDGIESQTTILAIERNTKALETVFREHDEIE